MIIIYYKVFLFSRMHSILSWWRKFRSRFVMKNLLHSFFLHLKWMYIETIAKCFWAHTHGTRCHETSYIFFRFEDASRKIESCPLVFILMKLYHFPFNYVIKDFFSQNKYIFKTATTMKMIFCPLNSLSLSFFFVLSSFFLSLLKIKILLIFFLKEEEEKFFSLYLFYFK